MIILDTNVLSELMRPKPSARVLAWIAKQPEAEFFTTSITEVMFIEDFSGRVYGFDSAAARAFSKIASSRRTSGRPISHPDAQIAAIAKVRRAKVATRDVRGFAQCGVDVVDPWNE
jgi:hypothetical protein